MTVKRLLALDVFRGATMMLMILVNTPGSWSYVYPPFRHAAWHGFTLTDLVFPFFLYIVGVSMWFSMQKSKQSKHVKPIQKIWIRAFKIFIIGTLLRLFPFFGISFAKIRIMGVLQRIAIAYAVSASLTLKVKLKYLVLIAIGILFGYWWVLVAFGGNKPFSLEENAVRLLDLKVFGENHLWHGHKIAFDPEGLLSTLPAIVTVLMGYFSAYVIQRKKLITAIKSLLIYGSIAFLIGWIWSLIFPINKALWTSSYVLVTGGIATILLAFLLWIIDEKGMRKWTFLFQVFGKNAILGFVLSGVIARIFMKINWMDSEGTKWTAYKWLYAQIFIPLFGKMNGSLGFAIAHIIFIGFILWFFYKKRIFLKV